MSAKTWDNPELGPADTAALWCVRLSEGPLTPAEQDGLAAWLDTAPTHRPALEEAAATWREFEEAESAPEFLQMRLQALQKTRLGSRRVGPGPRWLQGLAVAAAILVVAVGMWAWLTAPETYQTGIAERRVAVLADGSTLSLDAATTVRVHFSAHRRDLELVRGRAKFNVARNPLRPFSVTAGNKVVVATGTEFSVERLQRQIRVVLYEGHVSVLDRAKGAEASRPLRLGASATPADQSLIPGRELVVAETSDTASIEPADPSRALSWEAGQLVFVEEPLSSAVERVNRYSDEKLAIGDDAAGQVRVTGVFTAGDVPAFVEGVSAAFPVKLVQRSAARVFVSAPARR